MKDLLTGDLMVASTSDTGVNANGDVGHLRPPSLSHDGTRVAFAALTTNLDPADADNLDDVYVKDLQTGDITLASTSTTGIKSNANSRELSLAADGSAVAFHSLATNLDPADTDSFQDVYVKELIPLPPPADLGLTIADKPDPVRLGATVQYSVQVRNFGPNEATNVAIIDTYPQNTVFISVGTSRGTCTVNPKRRTVTCDVGSLANGASVFVKLVLGPQQVGTITNSASATANARDHVLANNADSESTSVLN